MRAPQFRYWLLTVPVADFDSTHELPRHVTYIKGQQEVGANTTYEHWQLLVYSKKMCLQSLKSIFPTAHIEPSRSPAAAAYVWKDDTAVVGTRFEKGEKPFQRNSATDWHQVRVDAESGNLTMIPDDVYVRYYLDLDEII